jgi:hypothetical protein
MRRYRRCKSGDEGTGQVRRRGPASGLTPIRKPVEGRRPVSRRATTSIFMYRPTIQKPRPSG